MMCVVAAKWFKDHGWVGVKNRDRNYIPSISFNRKNRGGVEIMLFWDDVTKYCEGLNSGGVCILSASLMVKDDEKEITVRSKTPSKDGVKIRRALGYPNVKAAARSLIEDKLPGNTLIYDRDTCYLLEGCWKPGGYSSQDYDYRIREIPRDGYAVRTNHGLWLPWAGYQRGDDRNHTLSRISSDSRLLIADHAINSAKTPQEMLDGLVEMRCSNPQLNAFRTTDGRKKMRTTAQIMITPSEHTMYVRPVQSNMTFNFWELNHPKHHLWVEILSNRILYKRKHESGTMPFPRMSHEAE